jgi:hypothetical protein
MMVPALVRLGRRTTGFRRKAGVAARYTWSVGGKA